MGLLTDKFCESEKIVRKAGRAKGRVQQVGFRVFVRNSARDCGVTGWVKNMSDGSVTMELQGGTTRREYKNGQRSD